MILSELGHRALHILVTPFTLRRNCQKNEPHATIGLMVGYQRSKQIFLFVSEIHEDPARARTRGCSPAERRNDGRTVDAKYL